MSLPFSRHLGDLASALVDGQLDEETSESAWSHVLTCPSCRRLVQREGWVKAQLSSMAGNEPPARLMGSLRAMEAWAAVDEIEQKGRGRRRVGLAVAGAGSVSVAVFGIATLGAGTLGIGQAPEVSPATSFDPRPSATGTPTHPVRTVLRLPDGGRFATFADRR